MAMVRPYGEVQPGIKMGIFTIRLPFVHYRFEYVEFLEGLIMCAACMSAIPVIMQVLEVPYEVAWSLVIVNGVLYNLHCLLGDPVIPGWITPSVPVTVAYLMSYPSGPERIKALIATQMLVAFIFLFMGATGLAGKIINAIPRAIKAGILFGAGFSAVYTEFAGGGRFMKYTWTLVVAGLVMFYTTFSSHFRRMKNTNPLFAFVANFGMIPAFLVAVFLGPVFGEIPGPEFTIGSVVKIPEIGNILKVTMFEVGFPEIKYFSASIATALVIYIIAFGDFITAGALVGEATGIRVDEKVDLNPNRSNLVCFLRNGIESIINPYPTMAGPMWSGAYAITVQRYKEGRDKMDSIFSGSGIFRWSTMIGVMLIPINGLLKHSLPLALSLMMLIQGYICVSLAVDFVDNEVDKGVAGVMGAILAAKGAAWGLIVGFLLYYLLADPKQLKRDAEAAAEAERQMAAMTAAEERADTMHHQEEAKSE